MSNTESLAAYDSVEVHTSRMRKVILTLAMHRGDLGLTCDEAEQILGLSHQGCSPRFTELRAEGRLVATMRTRRTRSGRFARVHTYHPAIKRDE